MKELSQLNDGEIEGIYSEYKSLQKTLIRLTECSEWEFGIAYISLIVIVINVCIYNGLSFSEIVSIGILTFLSSGYLIVGLIVYGLGRGLWRPFKKHIILPIVLNEDQVARYEELQNISAELENEYRLRKYRPYQDRIKEFTNRLHSISTSVDSISNEIRLKRVWKDHYDRYVLNDKRNYEASIHLLEEITTYHDSLQLQPKQVDKELNALKKNVEGYQTEIRSALRKLERLRVNPAVNSGNRSTFISDADDSKRETNSKSSRTPSIPNESKQAGSQVELFPQQGANKSNLKEDYVRTSVSLQSEINQEIQNRQKRPIRAIKVSESYYNDKLNRNMDTGRAGELCAFAYERSRVETEEGKDLVKRVRHVSVDEGDGLGYDIRSIRNGRTIYIEVKTTTGPDNSEFYMSKNEMQFMQDNGESFYLYRIYEFNKLDGSGKIKSLNGYKEIVNEYTPEERNWAFRRRQ